jgi:ADP-heptose:LPS heptosyltransferase
MANPKALEYYKQNKPNKIILNNGQSPGDLVMLTALVRDIHKCYPGLFQIDVRTPCPEIWENNPYLTKLDSRKKDVKVIKCEYDLVNKSNELPYHFIHGFYHDFNDKTGLDVKPTAFKGDIHISSLEDSWISQVKEIVGEDIPYWIIVSGGKYDFTAKWWNPHKYQEVVNYFEGRIQFVQVGSENHHHPDLKNVINLVGKTDLRQAIRLVYHSAGVVCPVTVFMHLAAAVPNKHDKERIRPCVTIAGGREGNHWEGYPGHQYLHTVGMLPCCKKGGCWKSKIEIDESKHEDGQSYCERPVMSKGGIHFPQCMDMISEFDVIRSIEKYLEYDK